MIMRPSSIPAVLWAPGVPVVGSPTTIWVPTTAPVMSKRWPEMPPAVSHETKKPSSRPPGFTPVEATWNFTPAGSELSKVMTGDGLQFVPKPV